MTNKEERLRILRLLEEGKISADDAAKLIGALGNDDRSSATIVPQKARWLRVRVTDLTTGRSQVDINLPADLVRLAGRFGARFAPEDLDVERVLEALRNGEGGRVLDVVDHDDGRHVEVFVE